MLENIYKINMIHLESGFVPVGAGVVKGWVGTLADVVSPGDRAPRHIPTSPAPTGTQSLPMPVCKKPILERFQMDGARFNTFQIRKSGVSHNEV
jgi:hypothetical protein